MPDSVYEHIAAAAGEVIKFDGSKVAAYKAPDGQVQLCSAVCPHLGCIVHFNKAEKS